MENKTLGTSTAYARDIILSRAKFLPNRLLINLGSGKEASFLINFLLLSSEDILKQLLEKSEDMSENFELWFFEKNTLNGSTTRLLVAELYDFLDVANSCKVEISSNTRPVLMYPGKPPVHHIDVVFHTYDR